MPRTIAEWNRVAEARLKRMIKRAREKAGLRKLGPPLRGTAKWSAQIRLVSAPAMKKLNHQYRRKDYATDVLSFPAPAVFRRQGILGELVICLPVMKRQAREVTHSEDQELSVLIAHGLLHLLGLDHERGAREAREMRRWEAVLLGKSGLIARTH